MNSTLLHCLFEFRLRYIAQFRIVLYFSVFTKFAPKQNV